MGEGSRLLHVRERVGRLDRLDAQPPSERDKVEVESILNDGPGLDRLGELAGQPKAHGRGHHQSGRARIRENLKGFRDWQRHYRGSLYDSDFHAERLYVNAHSTAHGLLLVATAVRA